MGSVRPYRTVASHSKLRQTWPRISESVLLGSCSFGDAPREESPEQESRRHDRGAVTSVVRATFRDCGKAVIESIEVKECWDDDGESQVSARALGRCIEYQAYLVRNPIVRTCQEELGVR